MNAPKAYLLHLTNKVEVRVTKQHIQSLRHATRRRDRNAVVEEISTSRIAMLRNPGLLFQATPLGDELVRQYDEAMQAAMDGC